MENNDRMRWRLGKLEHLASRNVRLSKTTADDLFKARFRELSIDRSNIRQHISMSMDTPEFQALSHADPSIYSYNGRWAYIARPTLYEIYMSPNVKKLVDELGIELTSYRELISRSLINKKHEK